MNRSWKRRATAAGAALCASVSLVVGVGCGGGDAGADLPKGLAKPGTDIPKAEVNLGLTPVADSLIPAIGVKRGYFEDVGIKITPAPFGERVNLVDSVAPLLRGQIDIGAGFPPILLAQLDNLKNVKAFALSDAYTGYAVLAPRGRYETMEKLLAKGVPFDAAAARVVKQLPGKRMLLTQGDTSLLLFLDIALGLGGVDRKDLDVTFLSNPDVVKAALAGRADLAAPSGAADLQQLLDSGWERVIAQPDLFEGLSDDRLDMLVQHVGYLTTDQYLASDYDTILRFTSVIYRIIDDIERDPESAAADYRDFVNSYTGASLSSESLASLFGPVYSLVPFEEAAAHYTRRDDRFNLERAYNSQLRSLKESGVLRQDHEPSDLFVAGGVWADLQRYKRQSERLLEATRDSSSQNLVRKARRQFDARNYLDSYRILAAVADE